MGESNANESNSGSPSGPGRKVGRKSAGAIAVVVLVAAYSFVQPILNEKFNLNLPGIRQNAQGQVVLDDSQQPKTSTPPVTTTKDASGSEKSTSKTKPKTTPAVTSAKPSTSTKSAGNSKPGPLAGRMKSKSNVSKSTASASGNNTKAATSTKQVKKDEGLLYGILREVGPKRYMSKAGLMYAPGSAEGHRLEHLRRHTKDDKSRPIHGVFDGEMEGALKTIDMAYERAKKNQGTTKKVDKGRTVYTVNMGKRIGYIGGKSGQSRRNPFSNRVRIVLDGNKVITAFPQ